MVGLIALWPQAPAAQTDRSVDVAIVLAVDASASVDAKEFALQMQGIAEAIRHPVVVDAIARGPRGVVALSLVQWSSVGQQSVILPWTRIDGHGSADRVAGRVLDAPRIYSRSGTAMSQALNFCMEYLRRLPFRADRMVIDISGDGINRGPPLLRTVKEEAAMRGVVINGLPILSEVPDLDNYFRDWVIAGENSFVSIADDFSAFREAMLIKLLREIQGPPMVSKRRDRLPGEEELHADPVERGGTGASAEGP